MHDWFQGRSQENLKGGANGTENLLNGVGGGVDNDFQCITKLLCESSAQGVANAGFSYNFTYFFEKNRPKGDFDGTW